MGNKLISGAVVIAAALTSAACGGEPARSGIAEALLPTDAFGAGMEVQRLPVPERPNPANAGTSVPPDCAAKNLATQVHNAGEVAGQVARSGDRMVVQFVQRPAVVTPAAVRDFVASCGIATFTESGDRVYTSNDPVDVSALGPVDAAGFHQTSTNADAANPQAADSAGVVIERKGVAVYVATVVTGGGKADVPSTVALARKALDRVTTVLG
ncbi:hypothetical protein EV193_104551 [Herbihabitans rhizosphaerae]|uniref:PknH-like protein n=1 Tax=Herbihabitans rhizosphaerae TaxID=1872711 RepID=A0A4Q7KS06_9PSEU|nr:hypothetical protein [Herbihabitans rhizosphaerae]RZS39334.1 hypothetical protein EV193_104551 [Herbihabitans rhizosphaerae]